MQFFGLKPFFWRHCPNFLLPSWLYTKKTTFLCWLRCTAGLWAAAGAHFGPKICKNLHFFTLHPYNPHFFWLRRIRLNGIISPPYPDVTLDTFSFPVGGRLAARRAVSWPRLSKVGLFGPKSAVFGPKSFFCANPPILLLPSWQDTKKTTFSCSSCCWACSWGGATACFWPKNGPKIRFFYATPI